MAEREYLPGLPPPKLVRAVRKSLSGYGVRPQATQWRLAWAWANAVRLSYFHPTWPRPVEIASQYVVLLLADMRESFMLRLPFRAGTHVPEAVAAALGPAGMAALPAAKPAAHAKPAALPAAALPIPELRTEAVP